MRFLVIGGDSGIGRALAAHLRAEGHPVATTSRRGPAALDLAEPPALWPALPEGVEVAYLCAAMTRLDACRADPDQARRVNVTGTVTLARRLHDQGCRVVFLSSDQVFDGTAPRRKASERPCPRTTYGRLKAEAEAAVLALGAHHCVVRLGKVIGPDWPMLVAWRRALEAGETIHPFHDLPVAPVGRDQVAALLKAVGIWQTGGVIQWTAPEDHSYADLAHRLAEALGPVPGRVSPVSCRAGTTCLEWYPQYATLDARRAWDELGLRPEPADRLIGRLVMTGFIPDP